MIAPSGSKRGKGAQDGKRQQGKPIRRHKGKQPVDEDAAKEVDIAKSAVRLRSLLRGVDRLLNKPNLPEEARVAQQERKVELEAMLRNRRVELKRHKTFMRYKHVRFFERVKLERQILSAKKKITKLEETAGTAVEDADEGKQIETEESQDVQEQKKALEEKVESLQRDLVYVRHYPYGEKYVSIFAKGADTPEVIAARDKMWGKIIAESKQQQALGASKEEPEFRRGKEAKKDKKQQVSKGSNEDNEAEEDINEECNAEDEDDDEEEDAALVPTNDAEYVDEDDFFLNSDDENDDDLDEDEFDDFLLKKGLVKGHDLGQGFDKALQKTRQSSKQIDKAAKGLGKGNAKPQKGPGKPQKLPHGSSWRAQSEADKNSGHDKRFNADSKNGGRLAKRNDKERRKDDKTSKGGKHVVFDADDDTGHAKSVKRASMPVDFEQQKELFLDKTLVGEKRSWNARDRSKGKHTSPAQTTVVPVDNDNASGEKKRKRKRQSKEKRKANKLAAENA